MGPTCLWTRRGSSDEILPRAPGAARLWRGRDAAAGLISNNLRSGIQTADKLRMSIGSLSNIASGYIESLITKALTSKSTDATTTSGTSSTSQTSDSNQLSPFAQLLSTLQQLQQSNPTEYEQVTKQIATNLTTAAQTATSAGNTTLASTLTQLAGDFTTEQHVGFEAAAWYWHFVDVVWIFLFVWVYWWGS